jgi:hypothetical protein
MRAQIPDDVEGTSRASVLLDGSGPRPGSQLYLWIPYGEPALGRRGVRTHRYTLSIEKFADGSREMVLYDNVADPYQLTNIAEVQPHLVEELTRTELNPWLERTKDPWLSS